VGRDVYFDTSSALFWFQPRDAADLIRAHGVQRVFFATDYPMWDTEEELARFLALPLAPRERKAILYDNAAAFLGL
jgi:predicted TIM-barrel fold metal-dependent hydrolase